MITPEDVSRVLELARAFRLRDRRHALTFVQWTETVLTAAQVYFVTSSSTCARRRTRCGSSARCKAEELPVEKLRYCLNRAPKFTDLTGQEPREAPGESLEIGIEVQLPDGGRQITQSGDHGQPLAKSAPQNPLRKEIAKLARSLHELGKNDAEAA